MSSAFSIPTKPAKAQARPASKRVRALVVDENTAARTAVKGLLQSLGIEQVQQASDPIRAIRMMEAESYGLVLCEAQFRAQMDGSQVLEYVRSNRLLPSSSAFLVMSAEAQRSTVAAVREWQPDGFVLKPLTAAALGPRIEQALGRRRVYAALFEAAEQRDPKRVLDHARRLSDKTAGGSVELLRWQTQALLDLGRFAQAHELCERAHGMRQDLSWVGVGLAHCDRAAARVDDAIRRLRETIHQHPAAGEAHDLLIEILQDQGDAAQAIAAAREALEQMPTVRRMRVLGELAYATGEVALAEEMMSEVVRRTANSLTRSGVDTAMLAQVSIAVGDAERAAKILASVEGDTDSATRAVVASVQAQIHATRGETEQAESTLRSALSLVGAEDTAERVLCVVAQGALATGLADDGRQLAERAAKVRPFSTGPGLLARKLLTDAGVDPAGFARVDPLVDNPDDAASESGRLEGPAERAIRCAKDGRFDEAVGLAEAARTESPTDPAALLALVHAQMLRMREKGFDADAATDVRRCLVELDRQIPGGRHVFEGLEVEDPGR